MFDKRKKRKQVALFESAVQQINQFETVTEIAAFLALKGIKGERIRASKCPIARYLQQATGGDVIVNGFDASLYWQGWHERAINLSYEARQFTGDFDAGFYPNLIVR